MSGFADTADAISAMAARRRLPDFQEANLDGFLHIGCRVALRACVSAPVLAVKQGSRPS